MGYKGSESKENVTGCPFRVLSKHFAKCQDHSQTDTRKGAFVCGCFNAKKNIILSNFLSAVIGKVPFVINKRQ